MSLCPLIHVECKCLISIQYFIYIILCESNVNVLLCMSNYRQFTLAKNIKKLKALHIYKTIVIKEKYCIDLNKIYMYKRKTILLHINFAGSLIKC